jgi:hypothetical protein
MSRRTIVGTIASAAFGGVLLAYLLLRAGVDLAQIERLVLGLRPEWLAQVTLLLGINSLLAGEKWRLIDRHLGDPGRPAMPRLIYFAFTAIGVGLGQIVPAQLSLALCRSLGAHLYGGRGFMRGATATLFDQFFDLLVAALLGLSSVLVLMLGGGAPAWAFWGLILGIAGLFLYGAAARLVAGAARRLSSLGESRLCAFCASLGLSPLLAPEIGLRLFGISALRFLVLVLAGMVSANAAGVDMPLWHLAASLPFAVLANALAITPGGIGINEWAVTSALFALGTPFQASAQWAVVNRVLVATGAGLCGIVGFLIAAAAKSSPPRRAV